MTISFRPRMTIRARLTLTYVTLLTVAGAIMLALVYVFMRFVPTYAISSVTTNGTTTGMLPSPSTTPHGNLTAQLAKPTSGFFSIRLSNETDILNTLLLVSIAVLVILAIAGAVIGWIVAGRILRPLKAINHAAQIAATGSLDHRVGLTGPHDEVRDLSDTFDDMLTQLDRSFQASQRFAANASHELRTPLATTQTMLDVALTDPELDLEELRSVAHRIYETNRRNMQTVDALLDLSEIGRGTPRREPIELDQITAAAIKDMAAETDRRGIVVSAELEPASSVGDPILIRQAVRNVVHNAMIHNIDGGHVLVRTEHSVNGIQLVVVNSGPVVSEDVIDSLTEPFVRAAGRIGGPRGHGLGLAITASVVAAEHGRLDIQTNDAGGLRVTLWFQAATSP